MDPVNLANSGGENPRRRRKKALGRDRATGGGMTQEAASREKLEAERWLAERMVAATLAPENPALWRQSAFLQPALGIFLAGLKQLGSGDAIQGMMAAQMVAVNGALMACMARAARAGDRSRARKAEVRLAERLLRTFGQHARALSKLPRGVGVGRPAA